MGTINLVKDALYRARIDVSYPSAVVGASDVRSALAKEGFYDLSVWLDEDDLPADWPADSRKDVTSFGHTQAWIQGKSSKPTGDYPAGGSKWRVIDMWMQAPAPRTDAWGDDLTQCLADGYTCAQSVIPCCSGNCAPDSSGTPRCAPSARQQPPGASSSSVWPWIAVAGVAATGVWFGWRYWKRG